MHRLFVALRPPPGIRARLLGMMGGVPAARWQDEDQLHLTLRFVGELDARRAEDVVSALISIDRPRPTITIRGVGSFHQRGRPSALWAGVAQNNGLAVLQGRIERALQRAGVAPEERAFHPHVTLARLGRASGPVEQFMAAAGGLALEPFVPDAFFLYESHLGSEGAMYEVVARYPLA